MCRQSSRFQSLGFEIAEEVDGKNVEVAKLLGFGVELDG